MAKLDFWYSIGSTYSYLTVARMRDYARDHGISLIVPTIDTELQPLAEAREEFAAIGTYVHSSISEGLGRIGVLVGLESEGDKDKLTALGRQIAMHVAATKPLSLSADDLDPEAVERERAVFSEQARQSGKPDNIIEKMVEGRIRKYYEEVTLLAQTFVIDGENTVEQAVKNAEADVGAPIKVVGYVLFALGEGIDKQESDFAAEVAAAAGTA